MNEGLEPTVTKLKPCPFCGSEAKVIEIPNGLSFEGLYVVGCDGDDLCFGNINHFTMVFPTKEQAKIIWNRRANNGQSI